MTIIIGRILSSIMNKPVKFKTKPIAPSFISLFSFFLNHLRITAICKFTKFNSIIICADINKETHLESIKLKSVFETNLSPQTKSPTNVGIRNCKKS